MTRPTILTVGSLNMDQIAQVARLPVQGETLLGGGSLRLVPGGKGANQAVAMARLEARVSLAGRIGSDVFGQQLLQSLETNGVNTALLAVDEHEASGVAMIFLLPEGENAIVVVPGANGRVGEDEIQMQQILAALPQVQALVLQLEIPLQTVVRLVAAGHQLGIPVMLNLAPARALPLETLRQLDVLVLNEVEASFLRATLAGASVDTPVPQTPQEASQLAVQLLELGIPSVVITQGAQGALLAQKKETGENEVLHQRPPQVQVVDTTAAGDCFTGAFTVAWLEKQPSAEALRFAVYASALKVTRSGAQSGLPRRAEVEYLLHAL
ncbi:MAG TPA: ribokinase [Ktedonobacteraceae bacterium]